MLSDTSVSLLSALYLKSAGDLKKGYSLSLLNKLLGFDTATSSNVFHYLTGKNMIDTRNGYGDNICLTWQGVDHVTNLRKGKKFKRIRFKQAQFVPPASRLMYGFLFWYDLINEDGSVDNNIVSVYASDVLTSTWQLPFYERSQDAEKILLRLGVIHLTEQIKKGTLNHHEQVELVTATQPVKCPYDPVRLIETKHAEYEIELPGETSTIGPANINQITPTITMGDNPKAFISYAWESDELKQWVKHLATILREKGIDAKIDQWEVVPGDQIPHFMENSVRDNDYVLIICSPTYKTKSEKRLGGVGYEGDIIAAEILQKSNHRKFIPILYVGTVLTSIPSGLQGKYYIDLSNQYHFDKNFEDLLATLLNKRESAPPLGSMLVNGPAPAADTDTENKEDEPIRIKGILADEVSLPLNDGSKGSALYKIPFELNKTPTYEWVQAFIHAWNRPPEFTMRHRPGIASVTGDKIILDGTTIEEVEQVHKKTLKLALEVANTTYKEIQASKRQSEDKTRMQADAHKKNIEDKSRQINFDD